MTASAFHKLTQGKVDPELIDRLNEVVSRVETELILQTGSAVSTVQKVGRHTLKAGGKRLRPAFVTLCAQAVDRPFNSDRACRLGAVMEMIHMATLIHDDVIDNSPTRRGLPTASHAFGATESILSGDVLLAKAMVLLAGDGDLDVIRAVSESVVEMAEGEVKELETRGIFDLDEDEHFRVLHLKTASFIQACCEVGGVLAGGTEEVRLALREYGRHIGLAFQVIDDILDYRGKGSETGKAQAVDFREGQATLPLIRLRNVISEEERQVLRLKFGNGANDDEVRMICGWMESRGVFAEVESVARDHIQEAREAIQILPDTAARRLLEAVGDFVVERRA